MPQKKTQFVPFAETGRLLRGYNFNSRTLAEILLCSPSTALKKINNPELLTLRDLRMIAKLGKVPAEEIRGSLRFI